MGRWIPAIYERGASAQFYEGVSGPEKFLKYAGYSKIRIDVLEDKNRIIAMGQKK